MYMFAWKDQQEAYGAFPPVQVLSISMHRAKLRQHICAECFAPIHIGERYTCTVYKEVISGKVSQYKCHVVCPYDMEA
jgi:hypothetical protein